MQNGQTKHIYQFDTYSLDPAERLLLRDGQPISLPPKAFETLLILVEHNGSLVDKETLLRKVWADSFVEEGNLKLCVHTIRKTLDDANLIETVPKKGYRFKVPVTLIEKAPGNEFVVQKETISTITLEATGVSDSAENSETRAFLHRLAHPGVYLLALIITCLALFGAFRYSRRHAKVIPFNSASQIRDLKTIAVLPLKSLSIPPQDQELRVGMADSIVTKLSAIKQLSVRPVSSTMKYLDQPYDAVEVGRSLKVDSVLEGSLQKDENKLMINLQMVSVVDGKVLWADSFNNDLSNVMRGEESVANRVTRLLALNLDPTSFQSGVQTPPNLSAQDLYLKGVYSVQTSARKIENIFAARDYFEGAIRLDPDYALAYTGLANTYTLAASLNLLSPQESYPHAEKAARRALELDPTLAYAHLALGDVEVDYKWDWPAAESHYLRAIELNPNNANTHGQYAEFLARIGRFNEAATQSDLAHQLNPTWINFESVRALHYFYEHRFADAIAQSKMVLEKDSNSYLAYLYLALAEAAKGDYQAGIEAGKQASSLTGGEPPDLFVLGCNYALAKDLTKTDEVLSKLQSKDHQQYVDPFYFSVIYTLRGDQEQAFLYLEKSKAKRSYWMTTLKVFPFLDSLQADTRLQEMRRELNLDE